MKTLYVGGNRFFNRFSNLEAAIERADHDDVIELLKDVTDISIPITKNITINGNGHHVIPTSNKAAFDCTAFVHLNDIQFECSSRTNAVIIRNGGNLKGIVTVITKPVTSLYPSIVQRGGTLTIEDSEITFIETYKSHGRKNDTVTFFQNSILREYDRLEPDDYGRSKFRSTTHISGSIIRNTLLEGYCTLADTTLMNFNKAVGTVVMKSCRLWPKEFDRPLNQMDKKPYVLHIAGGKVISEKHVAGANGIGFYMTDGSLIIRSTKADEEACHQIEGGSILFSDVVDSGFYEIGKARCSIIRSRVNTSMEVKTAMEELDAMIGLDSVKKQLRNIINTINVNMKYPEKDFGFSHHMVFAGDPGTGKTTVAKLVARALFEIGVIPEDKCMEVPASQLIKGFIGQTGEHVESVMKQALGGVLFIDEAYELTVKEGQSTFNNDALSVLLRYMEDHRDNLVVIAAGYEREMREFLASNVGLARRFQWVTFENYTTTEMTDILFKMSDRLDEVYNFSDARIILTECFGQLTDYYLSHPDANGRITNGGNGGLVRNVFQQIIFARNNRVTDTPNSTMDILLSDVAAGFKEEHNKAVEILQNTSQPVF